MEVSKVLRAALFAAEKHKNQLRNPGGIRTNLPAKNVALLIENSPVSDVVLFREWCRCSPVRSHH